MWRFLLLCLFFLPSTVSARALISEVLWAGSDLSTADEWVELAGLDADTDLSGGRLVLIEATATGSTERLLARFPEGSHVASGGTFLIANYDADHSRLNVSPQLVTTSVSLPNTVLWLKLYDSAGALLDEVGGGKPPAGYSGGDGATHASMERTSFSLPGTDVHAWASAEESLNMDADTLVLATPGIFTLLDEPAPSVAPVEVPPLQLRITALLADPTGLDKEGEWVEVLNRSTDATKLTDVTLATLKRRMSLSAEPPLQPGERRRIKVGGALSLANGGGALRLLQGQTELQTITYPALPTGVMYGELAPDDWGPICTDALDRTTIDAFIALQEGAFSGTGKVSVNLRAGTDAIAISCQWDFGDGTTSKSCNPGWKSYTKPGYYLLQLTLTNQCGNTVTRQKEVHVIAATGRTGSAMSAPASSVDPAARAAVSLTSFASGSLLITEIYAHPEKGAGGLLGVEWLRLKNLSAKTLDLAGWQLDDGLGSSATQTFGSGIILAPGEEFLLGKPLLKVSLNDGGETLTLLTPTGMLMDRVSYPALKKRTSFLKTDDGWCIASYQEDAAEPVCQTKNSSVQHATASSHKKPVQQSRLSPIKRPSNLLGYLTTVYRSFEQKQEVSEPIPPTAMLQQLAKESRSSYAEPSMKGRTFSSPRRPEVAILTTTFVVCLASLFLYRMPGL